jgi:DNA polymerase
LRRRLYLDTETWQGDPTRDLKAVGGYKYLETAKVMLLPWAIDDEPVQLVDFTRGESMPRALRLALGDPETEIWAHNAMFDRVAVNVMLRNRMERPALERWRCSMVLAMTCGLPGSLGDACRVMGYPEDRAKMRDGRALVLRFTKMQKGKGKGCNLHRITEREDPEGWERFRRYAIRDVEAMRDLIKDLPHWVYPDMPQELALWHLDQRINDRGLPMDLDLAKRAGGLVEAHGVELNLRALSTINPRSWAVLEDAEGHHSQGDILKAKNLSGILRKRNALLEWLQSQGLEIQSLKKADLARALAREDLPEHIREVLDLRRTSAKASTAKFKKVLVATGEGDRLRGTLQFYGAKRTGRFAGRMFQPHNLPSRGLLPSETCVNAVLGGTADLIFEDLLLVASSAIRGLIKAPEGYLIYFGDLSGIEARVLPWLAGEEWVLEVFRNGGDIYLETAGPILEKEKTEVTDWERTVYGKVPVLALGFQGGVNAFENMAESYGLEGVEKETIKAIVHGFRQKNKKIVRLWYKAEDAAWEAILNPGEVFTAGRLAFSVREHRGRSWLTMKLPSGRLLMYPNPTIEEVKGRFGPRLQICYDGENQYTKKWGRIATYGGKLVENGTQAAARDVMGYRMIDAENEGYKILLTVHDELVSMAPISPRYSGEGLAAIMTRPYDWSEGLPLAAKGKQAKRYSK